MRRLVLTGAVLVANLGCLAAPAQMEVELSHGPVTLSHAPMPFDASQAPADAAWVAVCVWPATGYQVSPRWTVLTPAGRDAQVVALAELANGRTVRLASPWLTDSGALCVEPRWGLPFKSPVRRVRLVASTPIVVERVVLSASQ